MEQYQYSRIAWLVVCILQIPVPDVLGQLLAYLSNITSGLSMLVVGLSISRLPVKAVFQDWKNVVSDADQTADISIAYDRISATASDRSGRDIEKCADPDGSIAGFFRAVHDYGTIWHQYGSGGAIGVYDNVV